MQGAVISWSERPLIPLLLAPWHLVVDACAGQQVHANIQEGEQAGHSGRTVSMHVWRSHVQRCSNHAGCPSATQATDTIHKLLGTWVVSVGEAVRGTVTAAAWGTCGISQFLVLMPNLSNSRRRRMQGRVDTQQGQ